MPHRVELLEAFPVPRRALTAVVGGGGKTGLIGALGRALARDGWRVVMTTTTRAYLPAPDEAPRVVRRREDLPAALDDASPVALVPLPEGVTKGPGLAPEEADRLAASGVADAVLVEADGSRGLPFKVYRPGEPVVPAGAAQVIGVIGADILGSPLGPETCHRSERLPTVGLWQGRRCGTDEAGVLYGSLLAILSRIGPFPSVLPFINKVEDGPRRQAAGRLARRLLRSGDASVRRVVAGSLHRDEFIVVGAGPGA